MNSLCCQKVWDLSSELTWQHAFSVSGVTLAANRDQNPGKLTVGAYPCGYTAHKCLPKSPLALRARLTPRDNAARHTLISNIVLISKALWRPKLVVKTFNSIYIYITPSNQHFKAFPMSKFNSETSFLYQLFKGNSNFTVWKPWKVIYLPVFYDFHCYLYFFPYMFIYAFIHLHINILKPSRCLNSIPGQVFCINFSKKIQIS